MNLKQFLKPSSENLTASGNLAFRGAKRRSNFYYWVKPDWRKIVIFVVLFSIAYCLLSQGLESETMPPVIYLIFPFFIFTYIVGFVGRTFNLKFSNPFIIIGCGIVFTLFCWYLLSCLIIWIFDKIKKKV